MSISKISNTLSILILSLVTACGGGGCSAVGVGLGAGPGNACQNEKSNPLIYYTGQYFDSAVKGLTYKASPSGMSGVTDENGYFKFQDNDNVNFSIKSNNYSIEVGSVIIKAPTNQSSITKIGVLEFSNGLVIAQVIQSLGGTGQLIDLSNLNLSSKEVLEINNFLTLPESTSIPAKITVGKSQALSNIIKANFSDNQIYAISETDVSKKTFYYILLKDGIQEFGFAYFNNDGTYINSFNNTLAWSLNSGVLTIDTLNYGTLNCKSYVFNRNLLSNKCNGSVEMQFWKIDNSNESGLSPTNLNGKTITIDWGNSNCPPPVTLNFNTTYATVQSCGGNIAINPQRLDIKVIDGVLFSIFTNAFAAGLVEGGDLNCNGYLMINATSGYSHEAGSPSPSLAYLGKIKFKSDSCGWPL